MNRIRFSGFTCVLSSVLRFVLHPAGSSRFPLLRCFVPAALRLRGNAVLAQAPDGKAGQGPGRTRSAASGALQISIADGTSGSGGVTRDRGRIKRKKTSAAPPPSHAPLRGPSPRRSAPRRGRFRRATGEGLLALRAGGEGECGARPSTAPDGARARLPAHVPPARAAAARRAPSQAPRRGSPARRRIARRARAPRGVDDTLRRRLPVAIGGDGARLGRRLGVRSRCGSVRRSGQLELRSVGQLERESGSAPDHLRRRSERVADESGRGRWSRQRLQHANGGAVVDEHRGRTRTGRHLAPCAHAQKRVTGAGLDVLEGEKLKGARRVIHSGRFYVCYTCRADDRRDDTRSGTAMKLLVTGGAGYIGSIVSRRLLASGHEVVVLDNLERGHRSAVAPDARLVVVDLVDATAVSAILAEGFDGVLHFAALALVGESVAHPERYYRTNVGGSLNLLEAMREAGVPRLVFSSTCAVYGQPDVVPISESAPPRPENAYGASKLAVDHMISAYCTAHGIGAVSLRYFNVAGASGGVGEDHEPETHLIPNILRAAAGHRPSVDIYGTDYPTPDGTAVRDYIHVDDLAAAHQLALEGARAGEHRIFNLGNGNGFSVREVIAATETVTGSRIPTVECPRRPGDPPMLVAAGAKVRSELGWEPRKPSLEQMIADAWEFARAHPDGYAKS